MTNTCPAPRTAPEATWHLVERAQAGDSAAIADIYRRNYDAIFRFVYFRVGNRQVAEDLTADVFTRAITHIGRVTWQGRDIGAWLTTIAKHRVADYLNSGLRRYETTVGDLWDGDLTEPDAADIVTAYLRNVALLKAVKQLRPDQQRVLVLRFLEGLSVAETAAAMHKTEGAIKALQYRATQRLARDERVRSLVAA